ncbi:hypothetical protein [Sphingomonas sp. Ant H11]|uniref:hypothetical protein n=1 Tax=Sphingomonas sp. Ant H11 TaxID=1564113 RepID=UPI001E5DD19B|nr:hypothetical protein [Sphingomonas sp. Ant H11]
MGRVPARLASSKPWLTIVTAAWCRSSAWSRAARISPADSAQIWKLRRAPAFSSISVTGTSITPRWRSGAICAAGRSIALGQGCSPPLWLAS